MILKEIKVNALVPTDRTLIIPIGPVAVAITGMLTIINLTAMFSVDFLLFTEPQYRSLPNALPLKQWVGSHLQFSEALPGTGPYFLMIANSRASPVLLTGKVAFGGQ